MRRTSLKARPPGPRWPVPLVAAALLWLVAAPASRAQEPDPAAQGATVATGSGPLDTAIVVEKLEAAMPPERPHGRFVQAERLEAGDEVHYTVRVRNPGQEAVSDVQVTRRLPFGLYYVPGSAAGPAADLEFSTDGGRSFDRKPTGEDFTHVRWILRRPLPPGATALLRFRATFR